MYLDPSIYTDRHNGLSATSVGYLCPSYVVMMETPPPRSDQRGGRDGGYTAALEPLRFSAEVR